MNQAEENKPSLLQVVKSVMAASFGVQSNANRERDFTKGSPGQYIIIGLVFTILFVLGLWALVKLIMSLAGV
jgi:hypothetical protein